MKVAFVISTFPPQIGGMGQIALTQALSLVRLGHTVTVFTLDYGKRLEQTGIRIEYLKPLMRLGDAGFVPQLFFKLRGFDLVHLHFPFYGGSFMTSLASIFFRVPLVVSYHMDAKPVGMIKNIVKILADSIAGGWVLKMAKKVILVDENNGQFSLLKKVKENNLVRINNAIDTEIFSKKVVSSESLNLLNLSGKKFLLFVGNLLPIKRLDLVLQAMSKLSNKDLLLMVVGGGYSEKDYRALAKELSLEKQIYFVGSINDPGKLAQYYSLADATVVASDYESSSLVVLESLSCSTPVIASDLDALKNKIIPGSNGLLFEKGNSDSLAKKIKEYFDYSLQKRKEMSVGAREQVCKNFSLAKNLEDLVKVYKSVI